MKQQKIDNKGHFIRPNTQFRGCISQDGVFKPKENRYHLYVSYACPWAHRVLLVRALRGLEAFLPYTCVDYILREDGWFFSQREGATKDNVNNKAKLKDIYELANPNYEGRYTVPVLWDKDNSTIVNNESIEIIKMLEEQCHTFMTKGESLYPDHLKENIDAFCNDFYTPINNGVYRCGFAETQAAYDESIEILFNALDKYDQHLSKHKFLCGEDLTLADICLFPTLFRFDLVYITHFKCNKKRLVDYENLFRYVREIYHLEGVKETCNIVHIKKHYFMSHPKLNPLKIVPQGPDIDFDKPVLK